MNSCIRGGIIKSTMLIGALLMMVSFRFENEDKETIKALFIYNFTKHVEWPKGKINGRFIIGVYGASPVQEKLATILRDRKIKDYPVEIRYIKSVKEVIDCDVLFIPNKESFRLKELNTESDHYGVLVITEQQAANQGACINIVEIDNKMNFEIDDLSIKKEGLKISKQLFELAIAR